MRSIKWRHYWWPWVTLNPQTTSISTFSIAFHIYVVGEHRDFIFGAGFTTASLSLRMTNCQRGPFQIFNPPNISLEWLKLETSNCVHWLASSGRGRYIENGARHIVTYNGWLIGNHVWPLEWCDCQWPWVRLKITFAVLNLCNTCVFMTRRASHP